MKRVAVFTSGGDAPGMNACIRAVVRSGIYHGLEVFGIMRGYDGMIDNDFSLMPSEAVSNIIQRGGTVLKSARSDRFRTPEGRKQAFENLQVKGIDGLIAIGGDGTFCGALEFEKEFGIPVIGIPGTIDNDLYGTDFTIGYDTAINTAVDAIDRIRDTADSHDRLFFIEVMGRDAGFIALQSGIAGGSEAILVPESKTDMDQLLNMLERGWSRKKTSMIVVVAEGEVEGGAFQVAEKVKEKFSHFDIRVSILGHIQRGGKPSCSDRVLGSRLGVASVEALMAGKTNLMAGVINGKIQFTSLEKAVKYHQEINSELLNLVSILST